jgi:hypothetical protein
VAIQNFGFKKILTFTLLKKLIAILLLAVYLFNLIGYTWAFRYFVNRAENSFITQLDQTQFSDDDLIQIAIPLHLPYVQNTGNFERIDGSVESGGVYYNYVKRMIHSDTLYILCLPNWQKSLLMKEKSRYAGNVNDFSSGKSEKKSSSKKNISMAEYSSRITQYCFTAMETVTASTLLTAATGAIWQRAIGVPERPPQQLSC